MLPTTRWKAALQDRTLGSLVGKQLNGSSKEPLWQMMANTLGSVWKNVASKSREILPSTGETTSGDVSNAALVRPHLEMHPLLWASLCMMDME